jgi:hypothetical protein
MCKYGGWRGIGVEKAKRMLFVVEQCNECGEYRAVDISDKQVVDPDDDGGSVVERNNSSDDDGGWANL